jgi:tol-pal system protein YbgF
MRAGSLASILCLAALAAAAGGCAVMDTGAFGRLSEDVEGLKKEVAASRGSAASPLSAAGRAETGDLSAVQRNVADLSASQDQVKSELLAATTSADETKVQMQKDISRLNDTAAAQAQALQEVRGKLAKVEEIDRRVAALEEKMGKLAAASPFSSAAPAPVPQDWKSPEEMYDYALGLIKGGDTRKGRQFLTEFASKHPSHKLLPNVLYWKGESFYVEKDYENAILAFQDVVDRYPAGDKAPDAMYKQGLSFLALKDPKNARILFELVQSKYPKSPAAPLARQKLAELK